MTSNAELSTLIGRIYDCALSPQLWGEVLGDYCELMDAVAASIHTLNPMNGTIGLYIEHGSNPEYSRSLLTKYAALSPTGASILLADLEQPIGVFDLIDEEEFRETRFYREWCAPQGYYDMLGALIAKRPCEIGAISATRRVDQGRFGAEDRALVATIAPHVRRAVTIANLLDNRALEIAELSATLDTLSAAVVIADEAGRILRLNKSAEELLAKGLGIESKDGALDIQNEDARRSLKAALRDAPRSPGSSVIPEPNGEKIYAAVMMLPGERASRAIFLKREEPDIPAIGRHLAATFAMTPREISVVVPLLQGKSPAEIADMLGISMPTVRTHFQRLYDKTGAATQADLVRLVLQSMPPVRLA